MLTFSKGPSAQPPRGSSGIGVPPMAANPERGWCAARAYPLTPIPFRSLPPFSVLASPPNPHSSDDESHRHSDPSIRSSPTPSPPSLNLPTEPRHLKFGTVYSRHGDFETGSLRTLLVKGDRAKVQGAQCPRCFGGVRGVGYEVYTTEFVGEGCVCGSSGTSSWIWM